MSIYENKFNHSRFKQRRLRGVGLVLGAALMFLSACDGTEVTLGEVDGTVGSTAQQHNDGDHNDSDNENHDGHDDKEQANGENHDGHDDKEQANGENHDGHDDKEQANGENHEGHDDKEQADDDDHSDHNNGSDSHDGHTTNVVYKADTSCAGHNAVPVGQASKTTESEPMGNVWCFPKSDAPKTAVVGANTWLDTFTTDGSMQRLTETSGYKFFSRGVSKEETWVNHNHLMMDLKMSSDTGGTSMRPDKAFEFQNGKLTVETDIAVGVPEFASMAGVNKGRNNTWTEITITDAPAPDQGSIADPNYAYGQFGKHRSIGCRINAHGGFVCSHVAPEGSTIPAGCLPAENRQRVFEVTGVADCGSNFGGGKTNRASDPSKPGTNADYLRMCNRDEMDTFCRDRIGMEITKDSLAVYVNGYKYFYDEGWGAAHQLPDSFVNGPVYVYLSNWTHNVDDDGKTRRVHWNDLAVNTSLGKETSPSFCFGEARNTCNSGAHSH